MTSVPHFYYAPTGPVAYVPPDNQGPMEFTKRFAEAIRPANIGRSCDGCGAPLKYDGFKDCRYCGRDK